MDVLRGFAVFVGWLAGSLAGITAIFYACGYLITLSNLNMLGLEVLAFSYEPAFYMQRGAGFMVLFAVPVAVALFGFSLLIAFLSLALIFGSRLLARSAFQARAARVAESFRRHLDVWENLAFVALLLLLLFYMLPVYLSLQEHLAISDVLLALSEGDSSRAHSPIREWIIDGKVARLQNQFANFVYAQLVAGLLLLAAWRVTAGWRWRLPLTAPFVLLFAMSVASLPLAYGILMLPNEFSEVVLIPKGGNSFAAPAQLYLLNKNANEFVVWEPVEQKILWIPVEALSSSEILRRRPLKEIRMAAQRREQ